MTRIREVYRPAFSFSRDPSDPVFCTESARRAAKGAKSASSFRCSLIDSGSEGVSDTMLHQPLTNFASLLLVSVVSASVPFPSLYCISLGLHGNIRNKTQSRLRTTHHCSTASSRQRMPSMTQPPAPKPTPSRSLSSMPNSMLKRRRSRISSKCGRQA